MGLLDWARRIIGAEPTPTTQGEREDRLVHLQAQDTYGQATGAGLTPARYAAAIAQADAGRLASLVRVLRDIERRDLHLQSVLGTRRLALSRVPMQVLPADDTPEAQRIADECDEILRGLPDLARVVLELADGVYQPLAVQEIVWGVAGGRNVPVDLAWVDPARMLYYLSSDGTDPARGELRIILDDWSSTGERLPADKLVIHQPAQMAGYPWQCGLGRGLGWAHVLSAWGLRWWATSTERDAMPFRTATSDGTVGEEDRAAVRAGLAALGSTGWAEIPAGVTLDIHETAANDERFSSFLAYLDALKSKAVLGHSAGADATAGRLGGEATADAVRQDLLEADAAAMAGTLRRDLLAPIVRLNWGSDAPCPLIHFDVAEGEDLQQLATQVQTLVQAGLEIPSAWVYERFGIPAPDGAEPTLVQQQSQGTGRPFDLRARPTQERVRLASTKDIIAQQERARRDLIRRALNSAGPAWGDFTEPIKAAVEQAESLEDLQQRLRTLGLDPGEIAPALADAQNAAYTLGQASAADEAGLLTGALSERWAPMATEQVAEWMEARGLMTRPEWDAVSEEIKARTFTIARHEGELVLDGVRNRVVQAIRGELSLADFQASYSAMMGELGWQGTSAWHLETVYRTNLQTAYSVGRYQRLTDPVVLALRPYWRYVAVGDESTRPSHRALDGLILPAGDPAWDRIFPPNGYNCRCTVISLSERQVAGQTISSTPPPDGEPDEGFGWHAGRWPIVE